MQVRFIKIRDKNTVDEQGKLPLIIERKGRVPNVVSIVRKLVYSTALISSYRLETIVVACIPKVAQLPSAAS